MNKKMNMIRKLSVAVVAVCAFVSCNINDPIYNTTHPDHGKITLTTDWTNIGTGITKPASYTVAVGDYSTTLSGDVNTIDNLFLPETYRTVVYNTADNIAISGTTATANYTTGVLGWLFSSVIDAKIEKDTDHAFTATMQQQVRQLTLIIEPTGGTADRIESITATLSGVASTLDINTGTHGTATSISLIFTKITSGTDAGKWSTTVRLLGISGSEQKLTGTITFTDGSPGNLPLESDLTSLLSAFNTDKKTPQTLGGTVAETPTEAGFTATISDWSEVSEQIEVK